MRLKRIKMMATMSLLIAASAHAGSPGASRIPQPRFQKKSDDSVVKSRYSNYDYAYSVRLPTGLTGSRSPSPFPNHGFMIQLPDHAQASVSVDGSYNAALWGFDMSDANGRC
jgi:hypothetical protein